MKSVNQYIVTEEVRQLDKIKAEFLMALCTSKVDGLNDRILGMMIYNLGIQEIKNLNVAFDSLYPKEYLPYYIQDDSFEKMDNEKRKEISQNMAKFILMKMTNYATA